MSSMSVSNALRHDRIVDRDHIVLDLPGPQAAACGEAASHSTEGNARLEDRATGDATRGAATDDEREGRSTQSQMPLSPQHPWALVTLIEGPCTQQGTRCPLLEPASVSILMPPR